MQYFPKTLGLEAYIVKNWLIDHISGVIHDDPRVTTKGMEHPTGLINETIKNWLKENTIRAAFNDLRVIVKDVPSN